MKQKPYLRLILLALAPSALALTMTGCAQEQKVAKQEPIQYSTFSGLRDYGNQGNYEILTPVKLNQCVKMQENFAVQKGALKDLQATIDKEYAAIQQENASLKQAKQDLAKYKNPDLVDRQNYANYNQALQAYNDQIDALRLKVQGYNNMQASYREKSLAYNQSVNNFNQSCAIDKKLYPQDLDRVATLR